MTLAQLPTIEGGYGTILADPPWRFAKRRNKQAPEHRRLHRYETLSLKEIKELPVAASVAPKSHLYLWVPCALLGEGLQVLQAWGFTYKTNLVWYKTRWNGDPDRRCMGFYFRTITEFVLFGVRGKLRTGARGRTQVNLFKAMKREHSRKPDELYHIIEGCSPGPYLELFARHERRDWDHYGDQLTSDSEE